MLRTPRIRLFSLISIPVLVSALTMSWLVSAFVEDRLREQHIQAAETLTSYLAMTSAERLVNRDLLGINVLLTQMRDEGSLQFASVYDGTNQLVAQAGQRGVGNTTVVNREITFQDTSAGYIQVGISDALITSQRNLALAVVLIVHSSLLVAIGLVIFLVGDFVAIWVYGTRHSVDPETSETTDEHQPIEAEVHGPSAAILVVKLRPTRLTDTHMELLQKAIALYGGAEAEGDGDSLVVYFYGDQGVFNATCTALLLLTLIEQKGPPLMLKVGLHWVDEDDDDIVEKATKHASYLSSISEQKLLASALFETKLIDDSIQYEPFHSSLTPDGEVILIHQVTNQDLIQRQAMQLLNG